MTIAIVIAAIYFVVGVVILALCKAAADGDRMIDEARRELDEDE